MTGTTLTPYVESASIVVVSDDDPDASYLEQDGWSERLEEYRRGDFWYVGVYAEARIRFKTPQGGWTQGSYVRTPGLWGIESDSGEEYLNEVGEEERAELNDMLAALGVEPIGKTIPLRYR